MHVYEFYISCTVHCNIIMQYKPRTWFILHNYIVIYNYIQYKPISWYILYNHITIHGAKNIKFDTAQQAKQIYQFRWFILYNYACIHTCIHKYFINKTVVKTMLLHNSITSLETGSTSGICIQVGV